MQMKVVFTVVLDEELIFFMGTKTTYNWSCVKMQELCANKF